MSGEATSIKLQGGLGRQAGRHTVCKKNKTTASALAADVGQQWFRGTVFGWAPYDDVDGLQWTYSIT
jgi:hypothetical protein